MLLSLAYRPVRCLSGLLAVLAVLVRSDLSKDAELLVLRHENQVLRHPPIGRPRWNHAGWLWLTALSRHAVVAGRAWGRPRRTPAAAMRPNWRSEVVPGWLPLRLGAAMPLESKKKTLLTGYADITFKEKSGITEP